MEHMFTIMLCFIAPVHNAVNAGAERFKGSHNKLDEPNY